MTHDCLSSVALALLVPIKSQPPLDQILTWLIPCLQNPSASPLNPRPPPHVWAWLRRERDILLWVGRRQDVCVASDDTDTVHGMGRTALLSDLV